MFDVVLSFFLLGALLLMAGGLLSLLWRLALQDEGIPMPAAFYGWVSPRFVTEVRVMGRLFTFGCWCWRALSARRPRLPSTCWAVACSGRRKRDPRLDVAPLRVHS